jgi:hypothetical protein
LAADLDGDGLAEIVTVVSTGGCPPYRLLVWHNLGRLGFALSDSVDVPIMPDGNGSLPICMWDALDTPVQLLAGDIDGDHRIDLLLLRGEWQFGSGGVQPFLRAGDGTYSAAPATVKLDIDWGAIRDFDGDGLDDLLLSISNTSGYEAAAVYRSTGGGTFQDVFEPQVPDLAGPVAAGDLDGDGRPDFAIAIPRHGTVVIYRNALPSEQPTPVLASLAGSQVAAGQVEIEWQLEGTGAGMAISIERTTDGTAWATVSRATPDGVGRLTYLDADVHAGGTYGYRLAWSQHGQDVTAATTYVTVPAIARLSMRAIGAGRGIVDLELAAPGPGEVRVELFDVTGRRIASVRPLAKSEGTVRVSLGSALSPGLYLARARMAGQSVTARVVVIR